MIGQRGLCRIVVLLAFVVRAYPLHVFFHHPDEAVFSEMSVRSFTEGNWRPWLRAYPSGLMYTLHTAYGAVYAVGYVAGLFRDRLDVLVSYLIHPFPFLLVGRVWSCLLGTATVVLVTRIADEVFQAPGGVLAGLFLGLSFLHARESHYGSLDAPAALFFTAAVAGAIAYARTKRPRDLIVGAIGVGAAAGYRYQAGVVAIVLPLTVVLGRTGRIGTDVRRLGLAAVVAAGTFALLSPYSILDFARTLEAVRTQLWLSYVRRPPGLPLSTLLAVACGSGVCLLAVVGVATVVRRRSRAGLLVIAAGVPCLAMLATPKSIYARYTLPLLPLIAVLAAGGVIALARMFPARLQAAAIVVLATCAVADPGLRTMRYVRLLALEDTRVLAGRWIREHVPHGTLVLLPDRSGNSVPDLLLAPGLIATFYGPVVAARVAAIEEAFPVSGYGPTRSELAAVWRPGAYLVTIEFPVPAFATVSPDVAAALPRGAAPVARFDGFRPGATGEALYEPIDANTLPLRGFDGILRPGPNLAIWRLGATAP